MLVILYPLKKTKTNRKKNKKQKINPKYELTVARIFAKLLLSYSLCTCCSLHLSGSFPDIHRAILHSNLWSNVTTSVRFSSASPSNSGPVSSLLLNRKYHHLTLYYLFIGLTVCYLLILDYNSHKDRTLSYSSLYPQHQMPGNYWSSTSNGGKDD